MFFAYTRPRYQVSVYRTIGPLVYSMRIQKTILQQGLLEPEFYVDTLKI